jgi:hypothetical protein
MAASRPSGRIASASLFLALLLAIANHYLARTACQKRPEFPPFSRRNARRFGSKTRQDSCDIRGMGPDKTVLERQPQRLGTPQRTCPLKAIRAGLGSHWTAMPSNRAAGEAARLRIVTSLALCAAARLGRKGQHAEAVTIEQRVPRYDPYEGPAGLLAVWSSHDTAAPLAVPLRAPAQSLPMICWRKP